MILPAPVTARSLIQRVEMHDFGDGGRRPGWHDAITGNQAPTQAGRAREGTTMNKTTSSRFLQCESFNAILHQFEARVVSDPALTGLGFGLPVGSIRCLGAELIAQSLGEVIAAADSYSDRAYAGRGLSPAVSARLTGHLADSVLQMRSLRHTAASPAIRVPVLAA
jgi:hypothetical protein